MDADKAKLKELYSHASKHSNYQILSRRLSEIIDNNEIAVKTRYESERLEYILKNVDASNKYILDIGGNSGYFTFEMLDNGARKVDYFEGNNIHAEFVKLASAVLNLENRVEITNEYFSFTNDKYKTRYDVILLLNVLHHIGDDYGNCKISMDRAKETIINQLNSLSETADTIVLQLGFNWKGNRESCLFKNGTKSELINFIEQGIKKHWKIINIGIAESKDGIIKYFDLDEKNIKRNDTLGEFLNRPIFIMKSLK